MGVRPAQGGRQTCQDCYQHGPWQMASYCWDKNTSKAPSTISTVMHVPLLDDELRIVSVFLDAPLHEGQHFESARLDSKAHIAVRHLGKGDTTDPAVRVAGSSNTSASSQRRCRNRGLRISAGCDAAEEVPVDAAGIQQGSDPVVVQVGEPEPDAPEIASVAGSPFEQYGDDAEVHCDSEDQARCLVRSISERLGSVGRSRRRGPRPEPAEAEDVPSRTSTTRKVDSSGGISAAGATDKAGRRQIRRQVRPRASATLSDAHSTARRDSARSVPRFGCYLGCVESWAKVPELPPLHQPAHFI